MRLEEARAIVRFIQETDLPPGSVCLNIGSSTKAFREGSHALASRELFDALEAMGVAVKHCDIKQAEGVDFVGDIFDPAYRARLAQQNATLILCCNILEHVPDPRAFAAACGELAPEGGYAVVSMPLSYPFHPDPIDTMLRLTPDEIAAYFSDFTMVASDRIEANTLWRDLTNHRFGAYRVLRHLALLAMPFYRRRRWRSLAHRTLWLFRPYVLSVALLRRAAA